MVHFKKKIVIITNNYLPSSKNRKLTREPTQYKLRRGGRRCIKLYPYYKFCLILMHKKGGLPI